MKSMLFLGAPLVAAALLAGCGGSSSSPSALSSSNAIPAAPQVFSVAAGKKCPSDNGVSVKPCMVNLDASNPTQMVTTKGPKGGTFTDKDTSCTKKDVAEVAGSGNTYTVTAGTAAGSCSAKFIDKDSSGKTIGTAKLSITNKL